MPPLARNGMYAAYNADFSLMANDNTDGRGALVDGVEPEGEAAGMSAMANLS